MLKGSVKIVCSKFLKRYSNLVIPRNIGILVETTRGTYTPYIAYGNGNTQPTPNDFILGNEIGRVIATVETGGALILFKAIVSGTELNVSGAREFGIFSGPTASMVQNTGSLLARTVVDITEYPDEPIVLFWEITMTSEEEQ